MRRYWLSILIPTAVIAFSIFITGSSFIVFLDLPSFIIAVVAPFFFVTILFSFKEMRNAFSVIRKKENEHDTLLKALAFFKGYSKTTWLFTFIAVIAGGIGILSNLDDKASIGPNYAITLETLFYCGVVQMVIIIPYTVFIHKQLGHRKLRSDLLSIFGGLIGVFFVSWLLFTFLTYSNSAPSQQTVQLQNQPSPIELLNGIKDKADVEYSGILEYELYNIPGNESPDFQAFIWLYISMLENGFNGAEGTYIFDHVGKYWTEDNTGLSENVKRLMDKHKRNLSTTRIQNPDDSTRFVFNCLNSGGKYEFYNIDGYFITMHGNPDDTYSEKKDYDRIIEDCNEAIRIDPNDASAYKSRGDAYRDKGEFDLAIADYARMIRLDPSYAWSNRETIDYDRAIEGYTQMIRNNPDAVWLYKKRGELYFYKDDYDHTIEDYTQVIIANPNDAYAYRTRGYSYSEKKDYNRAIEDYTQAIRINNNDSWAYEKRGEAYYLKDDYDRAIEDYTQAIRFFFPNDAYVYKLRGDSYKEKGDIDRAIADYTEAIRFEPDNTDYKEALEEAKKRQ